ncbi:hypothetical protein ESCO_002476 [Escovopsis weberi]|uniref:Zn(2)-C6 fungal-type domain-containing protein n=1 Tax=Escovopsis weberi TaxID=150374 RepID=A0A0M8MR60_ESCWE|nr:hypothetical protein ESCO_002476 [Escovopsis weberi]
MAEPTVGMRISRKGPKACTVCAKAKARCIPGLEPGSKCQRLRKECISRSPAPPRAKKVPKRSRVAELEKRLDELSSQFEGAQSSLTSASESGSSVHVVPPAPAPAANCGGKHLSLEHLLPFPASPGSERNEAPTRKTEAPKVYNGNGAGGVWPQPAEAETLLAQYHEVYGPLFPFIVLPGHLSAADLRRQKPFLWKAVMMASCFYDSTRQLRLGYELLGDITKAAYVDGVHSLDLLQGLLLMIGWFNVAFKSTQIINLLFLARSIGVGLSSPGYQSSPPEGPKFGSLEHIRAYAGTYYLNTLVFTTNKKTNDFMNASQLEAYCHILETTMEYASDEYLIRLVRIQQLTQSISLTMALDPHQPGMQLPLTMVVQSFQQQIHEFRHSLPPHLSEDATLLNHLGIAQVLVTDISISDQHCNSSVMPVTDRLELLWACVRSIRAFFDARVGHRCFEKPRFLMIVASDLAYAIITAMKLLMVSVPTWNPRQIVAELALYELLESHIQELGDLVARRRGKLHSGGARGAGAGAGPAGAAEGPPREDPMDRLRRLLKNGKELVDLQLQKMESAEVMGYEGERWMTDDLGEEMWANFMTDTAWNVNWDPMLMEMT